MDKIMYMDSKGRLTFNSKGNTFLRVGDLMDFKVDFHKGTVIHKRTDKLWTFKAITTWTPFIEEIMVGGSYGKVISGSSNVLHETWPGEGVGMAALNDGGVVKASILLSSAPFQSLQFPYVDWKIIMVDNLRMHGDVWLGNFVDSKFEPLALIQQR